MTAISPGRHGELEQHEVAVDWDDFAKLVPTEKERFIRFVEGLAKVGWFSRSGRPPNDWAFLDLSEYRDYGEYIKKLKKESAAFYEGRKAEKRGYYTKFFDWQTFIGDVVAINTSAPARQGRPMTAPYLKTIEEHGGYSTEIVTPVAPTQSVFWDRNFGTFRALPGHRQGELVVDEQLVSYIRVWCLGNFALYGTIIGHHDLMKDGIVYKTHLDFIKLALEARSSAAAGAPHDASLAGLRYLCYAAFFGRLGLMRWKKNNLFRPGLFVFDYGPAIQLMKRIC